MAQAGNAQQSTNPVTQFFTNWRNQRDQNQQQQQNNQQGRNGPTNQQQNRQQNQQQNQSANQANWKFDPETGRPIGGGASNDPNTQQNPLEAYQNLFDKVEPGQEDTPIPFSIKPEDIDSAAQGLDFMGNLPDDINLDGLGENKDTILQLMNHLGRMTYATSINHGSKLTDKWYGLRSQQDSKRFPGMIKDSMVDYAIANDPIASKNPVIMQAMKMVSGNLKNLYKDATPDQINQMAKGFYLELAKAMDPRLGQEKTIKEQEQRTAPGGPDFDWNKYLEADDRRAAAQG